MLAPIPTAASRLLPRPGGRSAIRRAAWSACFAVLAGFFLTGCDEETPTGIVFSHEQHLGRGFRCGLCHQAFSYEEPERAPEKVCAYCHHVGEREAPTRECAACHRRIDFTSGSLPRPRYDDSKFTHGAHVKAGINCLECHRNQGGAKVYADIVFPAMKDCTGCHLARGVADRCETCHEVWREDMKPPSHTVTWIERHGPVSTIEFDANCDYCHANKEFCEDCHMAKPPKSHTLFFRNRGHGFYAESDRMKCEPCHQQDFCLRCHDVTQGVRPASHVAGFGGRRPYLHCASCHFPAGEANGCNTCHPAGRISEVHLEAMDALGVPNVPDFIFEQSRSCLDGCHPYDRFPINHPAATLVNSECLICHRR